MKTLKDLVPEISNKIPQYKEKCTKDLYAGVESANFDKQLSSEYIEKIYELANFNKPVIIFSEDPNDYKRKYKALTLDKSMEFIDDIYNEKNSESPNLEVIEELENKLEIFIEEDRTYDNQIQVTSEYLFLCSSYHRVFLTWYKFIQDEFKIDHSNKDILNWLYERANNNILRCHFTDKFVLVLRMPKRIRRNENGFHSTTKSAIEWDNYKMYYINGRRIPNELFNKTVNDELTFSEFMKITDEDYKASIITIIKENKDNEGLMKFLNAEVVDEQTITHESNYQEVVKLWKTRESYDFLADINGNMGQPYAWLELKCPSSGSVYLIDTSAHFTDAVEACKFHRPQHVPSEFEYSFKEFNN